MLSYRTIASTTAVTLSLKSHLERVHVSENPCPCLCMLDDHSGNHVLAACRLGSTTERGGKAFHPKRSHDRHARRRKTLHNDLRAKGCPGTAAIHPLAHSLWHRHSRPKVVAGVSKRSGRRRVHLCLSGHSWPLQVGRPVRDVTDPSRQTRPQGHR